MWNNASPLTIVETPDSRDADIYIQYSTLDHGDGFPFDGAGGTLAHAYYSDSGSLSGQVHFDDDETWTHNTHKGTSSQHFLPRDAMQAWH